MKRENGPSSLSSSSWSCASSKRPKGKGPTASNKKEDLALAPAWGPTAQTGRTRRASAAAKPPRTKNEGAADRVHPVARRSIAVRGPQHAVKNTCGRRVRARAKTRRARPGQGQNEAVAAAGGHARPSARAPPANRTRRGRPAPLRRRERSAGRRRAVATAKPPPPGGRLKSPACAVFPS